MTSPTATVLREKVLLAMGPSRESPAPTQEQLRERTFLVHNHRLITRLSSGLSPDDSRADHSTGVGWGD